MLYTKKVPHPEKAALFTSFASICCEYMLIILKRINKIGVLQFPYFYITGLVLFLFIPYLGYVGFYSAIF